MLCFAFVLFAACDGTNADLTQPFVVNEDGNVGYWSFGGSASVSDTEIVLTPPVQYRRGSAWTNVEFPSGKWSVQLDFMVSEGTGGTGFAILLSEAFGVVGRLLGAPNRINGVAVLFSIIDSDGTRMKLDISVIQDRGRRQFYIPPPPNASISVRHGEHLIVDLVVDANMLTLVTGTDEHAADRCILKTDLFVNISDNCLGITAETGHLASKIELCSVFWKLGRVVRDDDRVMGAATSGRYEPDGTRPLRNPHFIVTLQELTAEDDPHEATSARLMQIIDEVDGALGDVASFLDVNTFVKTTMVPYAHKWQKRSVKIAEQVRQARNVVTDALNYTGRVVKSVQEDMERITFSFNQKVEDLEINFVQWLYDEEIDPEHVIDMSEEEGDLVLNLLYVALFECLVIMTVLFAMNTEKFQSKFF